jgi:hypothetical protein
MFLLTRKKLKKTISQALKGVHKGENSYWYGRKMSEDTKARMSLQKSG